MTEQERFYKDYPTIDSVVDGLKLLLIEFKARFLLHPKSKDITVMDKIAILTKAIEFLEVQPKPPAVDAVPVTWLNERHRKCCEEGDTDLMNAITVLCNEYHVWQKEQEAHGT